MVKIIVKGCNEGLSFKLDFDICSSCYVLVNGYMWENGSNLLDVFDEIL